MKVFHQNSVFGSCVGEAHHFSTLFILYARRKGLHRTLVVAWLYWVRSVGLELGFVAGIASVACTRVSTRPNFFFRGRVEPWVGFKDI